MKFDRARNAEELNKLFDLIAGCTIVYGVATLLGISWGVGSFFIIWAFKRWMKNQYLLSNSQLRVLALGVGLLVLLVDNGSSYCEGISAGYEAAARIGNPLANQSAHPTPDAAPASL